MTKHTYKGTHGKAVYNDILKVLGDHSSLNVEGQKSEGGGRQEGQLEGLLLLLWSSWGHSLPSLRLQKHGVVTPPGKDKPIPLHQGVIQGPSSLSHTEEYKYLRTG